MAKALFALCGVVVGAGGIVLCIWLIAFGGLGVTHCDGIIDRAVVWLFDRFVGLCGVGKPIFTLSHGTFACHHWCGCGALALKTTRLIIMMELRQIGAYVMLVLSS